MTRYFALHLSVPFQCLVVGISLYYTKVVRVVCDLFSALVDSTGIVDPIALREPENLSLVNFGNLSTAIRVFRNNLFLNLAPFGREK